MYVMYLYRVHTRTHAHTCIHAHRQVASLQLTPDHCMKCCGAEYGAPAWVDQQRDHASAAQTNGTAPDGDVAGHSIAFQPLRAMAPDGDNGGARAADAGAGPGDGADAPTMYVSTASAHQVDVSQNMAQKAMEVLPTPLHVTSRSPRLAAPGPLAMPRNGDGPHDGQREWAQTREERVVEEGMDDGAGALRRRAAAVGGETEFMEGRDALMSLEGGSLQASVPAPPVASLLPGSLERRGTALTLVCVCVRTCLLVERRGDCSLRAEACLPAGSFEPELAH